MRASSLHLTIYKRTNHDHDLSVQPILDRSATRTHTQSNGSGMSYKRLKGRKDRKDRKDRLADLGFYGFGMICLCFFKHCSAAGNFKSQFCINFDDRLFPHSRKLRLSLQKKCLVSGCGEEVYVQALVADFGLASKIPKKCSSQTEKLSQVNL